MKINEDLLIGDSSISLSMLRPKVVYSNPTTSQDFSGQEITIGTNWQNKYKYIEILYLLSKGSPCVYSTGKIPCLAGTGYHLDMMHNSVGNNFYSSRYVTKTNTGISVEDCYDSNNNKANNRCIPLIIYVY